MRQLSAHRNRTLLDLVAAIQMKVRLVSFWKMVFTRKLLFRFAILLPIAYFAVGVYFYCCDQSKWLTEPNVCPPGFVDTQFKCVRESFLVPAAEGAEPHVIHYRKYDALEAPKNRTIFCLHGNKGNMDLCEWEIEPFLLSGYDVWTMDYRGFGDSTGTLSEHALKEDARKVYDKILESGVNEKDIFVWGRSFGSGVAAAVAAANTEPGLLVLEHPTGQSPMPLALPCFSCPTFCFTTDFPSIAIFRARTARSN